jgi:hypothetical protein
VERTVRKVVLAADDMGDAEVDVVDDGGEVVRRASVRPEQRDPAEADRALVVLLADLPRRLPMPLGSLALPHRSLLERNPQPRQIVEDRALLHLSVLDVGVVDSQ